DITAAAVLKKLLKPVGPDGRTYGVVGDASGHVELEVVTSDGTEVPAFCKPMLGWGRRALKTGLAVNADEKQVRLVERLCELAAESWADKLEAGMAGAAAGAK